MRRLRISALIPDPRPVRFVDPQHLFGWRRRFNSWASNTVDYKELFEKSAAELKALSEKSAADKAFSGRALALAEKSATDYKALSEFAVKSGADYKALAEKSAAAYKALSSDTLALAMKSAADYAMLSKDTLALAIKSSADYAARSKDTLALAIKSAADAKQASDNKIGTLLKHVNLMHSFQVLTARRIFEEIATMKFKSVSATKAIRMAANDAQFMDYLKIVGAATNTTPSDLSIAASETYEHLSSCIHESVTLI